MPSPKFTDTFTLGVVDINTQFSHDGHDDDDNDDDNNDKTHRRQRLTAIDIFESADGLVVSTNLFFFTATTMVNPNKTDVKKFLLFKRETWLSEVEEHLKSPNCTTRNIS